MPKCSICFSKHREKIDIALTQGESERSIAKRFKVGASTVHRHRADGHICQAIETAAIEKVNGEISKTMEDLCTSNENIYTEFKIKIDSYCIL